MKAFLLGGGFGTRLRPVTDRLPKCLVDIDGAPLLAHWLAICARSGVEHVLLNVSHHADAVREYLRNAPTTVTVTLIEEPAPLGSAGTVRANRGFVEGESSFFVFYADNLTNVNLDRLQAFHATHDGVVTLGLFEALRPEQAGIVELGVGEVIVAFEEKPLVPRSRLANAGVYLARPALLDAIPSRAGVVDFGVDVLPGLAGRMYGCRIHEYLADIGTPDGLAAARRAWGRMGAGSTTP